MFTVVEFIEEKRRSILDYMKIFRKAEIEINEITPENGKSFYHCKAKVRKGRIPWKAIKAASPAERFILPYNVTEKPPVNVFTPEKLPQIMLFNSAVEYIKEKALSPSKTQITVVDKKGLYVNYFKDVIKLASHITVVTSAQSYRQLSDELLNAYGVSLIIRDELYEAKGENCFLFDYEAETVPLSYNGTVFSKSKKYLLNGKSLTPGGFDLPYRYEQLLNKNINKLHFASALYELCEVKELQKLKFNELCS